MSRRKYEYTAFLSFADQDRSLVEEIYRLFELVEEPVYCALEELPAAGSPDWRKAIVKAIARSQLFVPIYTRNSMNLPWVQYESGVADSLRLQRVPARVSGVSHTAIEELPRSEGGPQVFDLFDRKSLKALVTKVCTERLPKREKYRKIAEINKLFMQNKEVVAKIVCLAKTRWVFIAGNVPRGWYAKTYEVRWTSSPRAFRARLKKFSEQLAEKLLDRGFSIASCPQVQPVGGAAAQRATEWLTKKPPEGPQEYMIAGLYPIDRKVRESRLSTAVQEKWTDFLTRFRKSYMETQEWLIVVGGSEGTKEEYDAVKDLPTVKTLAIPCFGGAARHIWEELPPNDRGPCENCKERNGRCWQGKLETIVDHMEQTYM